MRRVALVSLFLAGVAPAAAQVRNVSYYEARYGPIADVSLSDLVLESAEYDGRGVRTSGRLSISPAVGDRSWQITALGASVVISPFPEVANEFEDMARRSMGRTIEVTGVFHSTSHGAGGFGTVGGVLQIWSFQGTPEDEGKGKKPQGIEVSLESLVTQPGNFDGSLVRVVGKFRGRNLYGDLPVRSERRHSDWVIKNDLFAVWVTGSKPKGDGFSLDSGLKRDTGKWLEVVGVPETRNEITYIKARRVSLTEKPAEATVAPPPPPPEIPKVPPVVVFSLPLDGELVPSTGRFVIQFSNDMKVASFDGHVRVRYAGPVQPGDRPFDGVTLSYDEGRRALTVDPGDVLRSGREVDVLLLDGIVDIQGLNLEPRPGVHLDDAVDMLRYRVGG